MKLIKGLLACLYIILGVLGLLMYIEHVPLQLINALSIISGYIGIKLLPLRYHWSLSERKMLDYLEVSVLIIVIVLMLIGMSAFV